MPSRLRLVAPAQGVKVEVQRADLLALVEELEKDKHQSSFAERFQNFVKAIGSYLALVGPLLPAFAQIGHADLHARDLDARRRPPSP